MLVKIPPRKEEVSLTPNSFKCKRGLHPTYSCKIAPTLKGLGVK
jgi:hypothetical protein